jgi:BCD family chlorophyll transporter-like MFS transporter
MGVWGAAQGVAFGAGGFLGTLAVDLARLVAAEPVYAYAAVFALEGVLFLVALLISLSVQHVTVGRRQNPLTETASFQLNPGYEAR